MQVVSENINLFKNEQELQYSFSLAERRSDLLIVTFASQHKVKDSKVKKENVICHRLLVFDNYQIENVKIEKSIVKLIEDICKKHKIEHRVAIGLNEKGFIAIYFGIKYNFDVAISGISDYVNTLSSNNSSMCTSPEFDILNRLMNEMIESQQYIMAKVILGTYKNQKNDDLSFLTKQFKRLGIMYLLDSLVKDETDDFFDELVKKHLSLQGYFPKLINYEVEMENNQLILKTLTSSYLDNVAVYFYKNKSKLAEVKYSTDRISYFNIKSEGIYFFKIFIFNEDKKKKKSLITSKIVLKKTSNGGFEIDEDASDLLKTKTYRLDNHNKNFIPSVLLKAREIPQSNGSRFYPKDSIRIGIICDEFFYNSLNGIANLVYINKANYEEYTNELDLLLVVTTWNGIDMDWLGIANVEDKAQRAALYKIIEVYKANQVPTAFYSKEDPVNYEIFIDIAKHCDYIFTTAEEKIDSYKNDCNNNNVSVWSFGINPIYHNPIGIKKFPKQQAVLFAGSWYEKYPERRVDTTMLLDGILSSNQNLYIIDRFFNLHRSQYSFPLKYTKYTSPAVKHTDLQNIHKLFNWSINLNTVKYSPTMFANRVYELQALGNIILSNYNSAINNKFPNVQIFMTLDDVKSFLNTITPEEIYEKQLQGIRRVMSSETSHHRLMELFSVLKLPIKKLERKVVVLVKSKSKRIIKMFEKQSYRHKELMLESQFCENVKLKYDIVAFFNEENEYGHFYLEDMINGFKFTDSNYITKDAHYNHNKELQSGIEFDYVNEFKDKFKTIFWANQYNSKELLKLKKSDNLLKGFSIDSKQVNEVINRYQFNEQPKLTVVVPIYNNGEFLLNKCFTSLKRSSMFDKMEIILVDDGSSDNNTLRIIHELRERYSNVKTYFYPEGGSGSASRARNKGVELATTDYIAFIDPDDEAINDGFSKLYNIIASNGHCLVVGNTIKIDFLKMQRLNYYNIARVANSNDDLITQSKKDFLTKTKFMAQHISSMVIRKSIILENKITMIEGAFGEDTIFFQELILNSKTVYIVDEDIDLYYAAVEGSAVNAISSTAFKKYLICEKERIKKYIQYDVLGEYLETRYEVYFSFWYLGKLKMVKDEEFIEAVNILKEIIEIFSPYYSFKTESMKRFQELIFEGDYQILKDEYMTKANKE